jgi:2-polyprenyl-3-methyl-5-hydroxy-6-metoxy-1,4-benzoquinol methylase
MTDLETIPSAVRLEVASCPLCAVSADRKVVVGRDRLHDLPGTFAIVSCQKCGLMRTSPRPTGATIGYYYPADYGPYKGTVVADTAAKPTDIKARLIAFAKKIFDTKAATLPNMPNKGRMLEIGCASGSFLHSMAQAGWQVEGIEFSEEAAQTARSLGYEVATGAVETLEKPESRFDLIVGWMVLEHLHDPVGSLQKMARWAKLEGKLAISVPNAGSKEFRIFGARWYALQLPTHLFHYDTKSIVRVLDAGGWHVCKIHHHRTVANVIASIGYWLYDNRMTGLGQALIDFPERGGRLGALLLFPISFVFALFGQTGRMTIWADRKQP